MFLSGFADEATPSIDDQVAVIREIGWSHLDIRNVDGTAFHDLDDAVFDRVLAALGEGGVRVRCAGSAIANGKASIDDDFEVALAQTERSIRRCQQLGCAKIRIMSWPPGDDRSIDEPMAGERIRRVAEIHRRFADAGIEALHENCFNYGGQSAQHSLRLVEEVPGLRLIFDPANCIPQLDWAYPGERKPQQSPWEFWCQVRDHVGYLHIKDGLFDPTAEGRKFVHGWPGEGQGDVRAFVKDACERGYDDGIAIEPHVGGVQLIPEVADRPDERKRRQFIEYGHRMTALMADIGHPIPAPEATPAS